MSDTPHSVGEILDNLSEQAADGNDISVGDIADTFGARTFGPAIMVPALLELTPIGAIPGVPTVLAAIIALVAAQKMFGKKHLWIPGFLAKRTVTAGKMDKAVAKLRPIAKFMDKHFHGRFKRLTHAPFSQIAAGIVILLCCTVPFLEVLPFASSGPMLAIAMFGLAVLVRDGALMIVALLISLLAMAGGAFWWGSGGESSG